MCILSPAAGLVHPCRPFSPHTSRAAPRSVGPGKFARGARLRPGCQAGRSLPVAGGQVYLSAAGSAPSIPHLPAEPETVRYR